MSGEADALLADEVLLVGGVDEDRLAVLLVVRHVGHVDVQSAAGDALGNTIGEQRFERRCGVTHEERSTRHIRLDDRVWVSGIEEALLGVLDEGSGLSRVCRSKCIRKRKEKRETFEFAHLPTGQCLLALNSARIFVAVSLNTSRLSDQLTIFLKALQKRCQNK